jgi:hypothetical protein
MIEGCPPNARMHANVYKVLEASGKGLKRGGR